MCMVSIQYDCIFWIFKNKFVVLILQLGMEEEDVIEVYQEQTGGHSTI